MYNRSDYKKPRSAKPRFATLWGRWGLGEGDIPGGFHLGLLRQTVFVVLGRYRCEQDR